MSMVPPNPLVTGGELGVQPAGLQRLAVYKFTVAAQNTPVINIPPRDFLSITIAVPSTAGAVNLRMLFGGANGIDASANYWHRNMESSPNSDIVNGNFNNASGPNAGDLVLGYSAVTTPRLVFITINNTAGGNKTVQWSLVRGTGSAATVGFVCSGWGEWFSASQLTSLQFGLTGASSYGVGTRIAIFGRSVK